MHDGAKIIPGLTVFLALALTPVWRPVLSGPPRLPEPKIAFPQKPCVLPREAMRERHMVLLNSWRDTVVRQGRRSALTADGRTVTPSLTGTCLRCHPNKAEFCDSCHNQLAVKPVCFSCHLEPKEKG